MKGHPAADDALERAMTSLRISGIAAGHRLISPGDEAALLPEEAASIVSADLKARRASGAARIAGRQLLQSLGVAPSALPKEPSGEPRWPDGLTGSFAHDDSVAVAAAALRRDVAALGIDVEPAIPLAPDLLPVVVTLRERTGLGGDPYRGRLHFAIKEAVYKAVSPLDGIFLEFHDIEIDLKKRKAIARNGRMLDLRYCASKTHIVALAWIAA